MLLLGCRAGKAGLLQTFSCASIMSSHGQHERKSAHKSYLPIPWPCVCLKMQWAKRMACIVTQHRMCAACVLEQGQRRNRKCHKGSKCSSIQQKYVRCFNALGTGSLQVFHDQTLSSSGMVRCWKRPQPQRFAQSGSAAFYLNRSTGSSLAVRLADVDISSTCA